MNNIIPKPEATFARTNLSRQAFPYPNPIMNYIKMNPTTPKLCINLLESCKYFYSKQDLLIPLNGKPPFDKYSRFNVGEVIRSQKEPMKYQLPFKVWLIECLSLAPGGYIDEHKKYYFDNFYFFKTAVRCTLKQLHLDSQRITLKEFQFLTENGLEKFQCYKLTVLDSGDTVVPIEKIFAYLKNIKEVNYTFGKNSETGKTVTAKTAKNLIKTIDTSKLKIFHLQWIPATFDFKTFKKFIKLHPNIFFYIDKYPF